MFAHLHLLLVCQFVEDFTQLSVNYGFAGRVVGTVGEVVSSSEGRDQVFHVELEMGEEVDVLSGLEGT